MNAVFVISSNSIKRINKPNAVVGYPDFLLEVRDDGIGFPPQDAQRILKVSTRLQHGEAQYRGTGVGLSIAQNVVPNHGGYIWAESSPGEGATFKVLLPL